MSEIHIYRLEPPGRLVEHASLEDALAAAREGGFLWLDYSQPTREDLSAIAGPLGLHPLSVEDCIDADQVPKIEDYPRNTFIIFNSFDYSGGTLTIGEIDLFISDAYLVSVSRPGPDGRRFLEGIKRLVEQDMASVSQGPAYLLHILLDHIVDRKFSAIEALEEELNRAEETMLGNVSGFKPVELLRIRRELLALRKSLFHEREILVKICRKDCPFIPEKALFAYRDIYDHLAKFFELTESYRDLVTSLMEMHLSMLNNQMARVANRTNSTVRRLTFITTIFMPLTLLAGIGGMSEWSMMTGPSNWRIAYPLFIVAMVGIGAANYFLLKWLERRDRDGGRRESAG